MKSKKLKLNMIADVQKRIFSRRGSKFGCRAMLRIIHLCCVAFFAVSLFTFPVNAETKSEEQLSVESTSKINEELNLTVPAGSSLNETNKPLQQKLQQARINAYQGEKDGQSRSELKRMIEQVRNILFLSQKQPSKSVSVIEPAPVIEPNTVSLEMKTHEDSRQKPKQLEIEKSIKAESQYEPVSRYTRQMLENLAQNPDQLTNPFELAEVLYLGGYENKAIMFYREALNRRESNGLGSNQEKAWILFQIGNCLRNDDLQSAKSAYRQLIAEYPDYLLTDLAKVQDKLIDWYLTDKPHELIKECEQLAGGK